METHDYLATNKEREAGDHWDAVHQYGVQMSCHGDKVALWGFMDEVLRTGIRTWGYKIVLMEDGVVLILIISFLIPCNGAKNYHGS